MKFYRFLQNVFRRSYISW